MKASDIIEALRRRHPPPEWVFFDELRAGSGWWSKNSHVVPEQRVDAWAMNCWSSRHYLRVAYEVKVSRSDFLNELKESSKRESALAISNEFYFAVPRHLVAPAEVPDDAGLIWFFGPKEYGGRRLYVAKPAPYRETPFPGWPFVASLARRMLLQAQGKDSRSAFDLE